MLEALLEPVEACNMQATQFRTGVLTSSGAAQTAAF